MRNAIGNLIGITLTLYIALRSIVIFAILILQIQEHNICIHLFVSFLIVVNIFSVEYFMFIEKALFTFAIFTAILASYFMSCLYDAKLLAGKINLKKMGKFYALVILTMVLSVFSYQACVGIAVVLNAVLACKFAKELKEYFVNLILTIIPYTCSMILNFVVMKANSSGRVDVQEKFDFA